MKKIIIDRKTMTQDQLDLLLAGEIIAFFAYDILVKQKLDHEYVDIIGSTYASSLSFSSNRTETYLAFSYAGHLLKKFYDTDIYTLPFWCSNFKKELQKYEATYEINNKAIKNNDGLFDIEDISI